MNCVHRFLKANRQRLALERYGLAGTMGSVLLTPRFHASSHVVFLVMAEGRPDPVLVAKIPRLDGAGTSIEREAENLQYAQSLRPGGFDSIPHVVAFEQYCGRPILVQTALCGRPISAGIARRRRAECCEAVLGWLTALKRSDSEPAGHDDDWYGRLVERPLNFFADVFPLSAEEQRLLDQTWQLVAPLRESRLPAVLEHGDLNPPNLMLLNRGGLGAVDWELAQPHGLPTYDLFFFLAFTAFASTDAQRSGQFAATYHQAFFAPGAWARRYVAEYAKEFDIPRELLTPLLALCWVRYMSGLLFRLGSGASAPITADSAAWMRSNRYYTLWQHTLEHLDQLNW